MVISSSVSETETKEALIKAPKLSPPSTWPSRDKVGGHKADRWPDVGTPGLLLPGINTGQMSQWRTPE